MHIPTNIFKVIGTDKSLFYIDNNIDTILQVETDYDYSDIRSTDIVMDIGACIGAFSIKVSDMVDIVYAIEPLMICELEKNIILNDKHNIFIFEASLGNGLSRVVWDGKHKNLIGLTLTELINIAGGHIDFLKIDCEGGEHTIHPEEIMNIRRIEAEIHIVNQSGKSFRLESFEDILKKAGFEYTKQYLQYGRLMLIHAKNKRIP